MELLHVTYAHDVFFYGFTDPMKCRKSKDVKFPDMLQIIVTFSFLSLLGVNLL